jgi:tetratricopeptide (TPR) repeat protein
MPSEKKCGRCGTTMDEFASATLCPKCLLGGALDFEDNGTDVEGRVVRPGSQPGSPSGAPAIGRFGDYELLGEIAHGGMGVVYQARQISLNRLVAVKMILAGRYAGREFIQRFHAEAEAAAKLQHPNIVAIHEIGEHEGHHYFSMDYVEGKSLAQMVHDQPLPAERAAQYVKTVAEAIHYAHQRGVLHRDLKPSNVLIDAFGEPRVTDFGLAKRFETPSLSPAATEAASGGATGEGGSQRELTVSGQVLGTPGYMPPEQAGGRRGELGPPSDVYSLGAILYYLLAVRPPFLAGSLEETLSQVLRADVPSPRAFNPSVPRDLETICLKCLEKEPRRRYGTAQELASELGRYLAHEPIHALPPSTFYRCRKFARRHQTAVMAAALIVLLLTAGTIVSTTLAFRANRARVEEAKATALAQASERKAKGAAEESAAVLRFFEEHVLAAGRPKGEVGGLGREATIRAAVEVGEATLKNAFTEMPQVEASIRKTLGLTYHYLGDDLFAIAQLERALGLRRADSSLWPTNALDILHALSESYRSAGQLTNALPMMEQTLKLEETCFSPADARTVSTMNSLAIIYYDLGKIEDAAALIEKALQLRNVAMGSRRREALDFDLLNTLSEILEKRGRSREALPLHEEVRQGYLATLGPTNRQTLTALNNLALSYVQLKRPSDAVPLLQEAYAGLEKILGPDHPVTIQALDNLAFAFHHSGKTSNTLSLYEEAHRRYEAKLGSNHVDTLKSLNNLAEGLNDAGRYDEALLMREQALERGKATLGAEHPDVLVWMHNLALAYSESGRNAEAVPLLEEVFEKEKRVLGPDNPVALKAMVSLGTVYRKAGRIAEALEILKVAVERYRATFGMDYRDSLHGVELLAKTFQTAGRTADALPLFEEVVSWGRKKPGASHPDTLVWIHNLARGYEAVGRIADALPLYEEAWRGLKIALGPKHPTTLAAMEDVPAAYMKFKRISEAEPLFRELLDMLQKTLPLNSSRLANARLNLGECLYRQSKFAEAEPFLRESLRIRKENQPENEITHVAQGWLGLALLGQKRFEEAERVLVQDYQELRLQNEQQPSASIARTLKDVGQHLVHLYDAWGKSAQADEWRKKIAGQP